MSKDLVIVTSPEGATWTDVVRHTWEPRQTADFLAMDANDVRKVLDEMPGSVRRATRVYRLVPVTHEFN